MLALAKIWLITTGGQVRIPLKNASTSIYHFPRGIFFSLKIHLVKDTQQYHMASEVLTTLYIMGKESLMSLQCSAVAEVLCV